MKNKTFDFHGSKFTIKVLTSESNGNYTVLDVIHPPNIGPALHIHPQGPETFYIVEGDYEFILNDKSIMAKAGDVIFVPKNSSHKFVAGNKGGHIIVISPPQLEFYFWEISKLLDKEKVSFVTESNIAKQYGQIFIDNTKHWK